MPIKLCTVDAFATTAFAGNPAAVCLLEEPRAERWMQQVAAEMNLSETAFVERRDAPSLSDGSRPGPKSVCADTRARERARTLGNRLA